MFKSMFAKDPLTGQVLPETVSELVNSFHRSLPAQK
jgi:hypothetical protein